MNQESKQFFIKIGKREYIEELYNKGKVFINTVDFFRKHKNPEIGYNKEGVDEVVPLNTPVYINGIDIPDNRPDNITITYDKALEYTETHIYSMTYKEMIMEASQEKLPFNVNFLEGNYKEFGDTILFIISPNLFIEKLENALKKKKRKFEKGLIKYKEDKKWDVFTKPMKYKSQNEYRYAIYGIDNKKPLVLELGSLQDIAIIMDLAKFRNQIEYKQDLINIA